MTRTPHILIGIALLTGSLAAQKYSVTTYGAADGLLPFAVERLHQDPLGNLWMTTSGGLMMYNGKSFRSFGPEEGLPAYATRAIAQDADKGIWVGTLGGGAARITRLSTGDYSLRAFTRENGLPDNSVLSLLAAADGSLWVGTKGGLAHIRRDRSDTLHVLRTWQEPIVNCMYQAKDGSLWFGDMSGAVHVIAGDTLRSIPVFPPHASGVTGLAEDAVGDLWVTSFAGGARKLHWVRGRWAAFSDASTREVPAEVFHVHRDGAGRLWFATFGEGVVSYDGRRFQSFSTANGLPENNTVCTFVDRQGLLWVGTANSGLCKRGDLPFVFFDKETGLPGNLVLDVIADRRGFMWVSCYESGLVRFDGTSIRGFSRREGLTSRKVYALMETADGRIWVSTMGEGVFVYDGKRFKRFRSSYLLTDVLCMFEDREGQIWFGTDTHGAVRLSRDGSLLQFTPEQGLAGLRVFSILQDRRGRIWFGCGQPSRLKEAGGVSVWDPVRFLRNLRPFVTYDKQNGFPSNEVIALYEDRDGAVWLGTRHHGLFSFSNEQFTPFGKREGLLSNTVTAIGEDRRGRLWVGTVKGLHVRTPGGFDVYTKAQGLLSDEIYENAMALDRDGRLWLGTPGGLCRFRVDDLDARPSPPSLYVDRVLSNGQPLEADGMTDLSHARNDIDFQVTGIDFRAEKHLMYQYFLEGFDANWRDPTPRDYLSYTNLEPRSYVFHARVSGSSGAWSDPVTMPFIIHPAFWQTWWFRGTLLTVLIVSVPYAARVSRSAFHRFQTWRRNRTIAHYRLKGLIGEGAMGSVYEAYDRTARKTVALKVIHRRLMEDPENQSRFEREGRILSKLSHPNVVRVYAAGQWMGRGYIAMEVLPNGNLRDYVSKHFPLDLKTTARLLTEIAEGLAYIHGLNIVHRDLKSENIMLDERWRPKIMDFGLSKSTLVTTMTQVGTIMGTLGYVAPEQVTGHKVDQRSDLFSFGVIMYEMLTRMLPFRGENEIALIHSIFNDLPELPSNVNPTVFRDHEWIVLKCLEKDPAHRYQSCEELLKDFRSVHRLLH